MYMPEQCYCCVLQMLAKTGLFLAVKLQFCRLCHVPALRLTLSLQPWLCEAGITVSMWTRMQLGTQPADNPVKHPWSAQTFVPNCT
jgi:hypothetical protein